MKKKLKWVLMGFSILTPIAIATPFITSCGSKKEVEQKPIYRFYLRYDSTSATITKQQFMGLDDFYNEIWKDVSYNTLYIYTQEEWDKFSTNAKNDGIPIYVYRNGTFITIIEPN